MTDNSTIIHVGDVGTVITLTIYEDDGTTVVDVSGATTKMIYFLLPDGTKKSADADFTTDGTDGKIQYTAVSGFIDTAGLWQCQGYVEFGITKYYSTKARFHVHSNLA